jgi:hypothetical protein
MKSFKDQFINPRDLINKKKKDNNDESYRMKITSYNKKDKKKRKKYGDYTEAKVILSKNLEDN